ncbi:MAG: hypothetical protein F6K62_22580 [Sphaerospermopsis sp. SIO1G2]|nr:hypothetical protein [Sphaerospermopsis sp. SIO1G2]
MKQKMEPSGNFVAAGFSFGIVMGIALGQATGYPLVFMPLGGIVGAVFGWYYRVYGRGTNEPHQE